MRTFLGQVDCPNHVWVVVKIIVPFLDSHYNTAPNIKGSQKGAIILATTHIVVPFVAFTIGQGRTLAHPIGFSVVDNGSLDFPVHS